MKARTFQVIIFCLLMAPIGGCSLTSEQRVAELQKAVMLTQNLSNQLSARILDLEKALADAQALAKQPGVPPATVAKLQTDIAALQTRIAQAKPMQEALDQQLAAYQTQLTAAMAAPIDIAGEAQVYGQGISTIGAVLPPPFNVYAGLIGSMIGIGGGFLGAFLKGKKDGNAFDGMVAATNALLDSPIIGDKKEEAKSVLARGQAKNANAVKMTQKSLAKVRIAKAA